MDTFDFIFETSWEVCNKVGGIHTVLMTKAKTVCNKMNGNYILIGPDLHLSGSAANEFIEDDNMFQAWKNYALSKGIKMRIGHCNIVSHPTVILVEFSQYFSQKNEIFAKYWETFQVDSLTGGWDYIEPFIFGYAAAKVIESYYDFYIHSSDRVVAHFHEWMTGSGVLYLKTHLPQIATVFTTHATVLGRCLAGNNVPLYSGMEGFAPDSIARNFNIVSKYSLEKLSALNADAFTVVSSLTDIECKKFFGRNATAVTPNGFEGDFVPSQGQYQIKREQSRTKIFDIIEKDYGFRPQRDSFLIINSGRYELKNKGIDVFIKSMAALNQISDLQKKVIAIIAVPASDISLNDPIINLITKYGFENKKEDNVTILFIPSYLDGNDGKVNIPYFDFLTAFDLSIFPSYYEPWGYTPMEGIAFGIPSITTTLTGFGLWVGDNMENKNNALTIINRNDVNEQECIDNIVLRCKDIINSSPEYKLLLKQECINIFKQVEWSELIRYYYEVYNIAISKALSRYSLYADKKPFNHSVLIQPSWGLQPKWKKLLVKISVPERLQPLREIAQNLWWSWNYDAYDLFCKIDKQRFFDFNRSPIRLIQSLTNKDYERLCEDNEFLTSMDNVVKHFQEYVSQRKDKQTEPIAYFSMEFGIDDTLQIFSGGLGMLAGDYLKQASDDNRNIIGVGLLYRQGYFVQHITKEGNQQSKRYNQKFSLLPLHPELDNNGKWKKISINLYGTNVYAKIWRCDVGVVPLYLLDTDIDDNNIENREITSQLYGGDNNMRLKQEILLGIGGQRLLKEMNINPKIYHLNEGHSAFCTLERLYDYINKDGFTYAQALEIVRYSTLFTTHTPVAAGHDAFEEDLMRSYFSSYSQQLNLSWDDFMLLGRKSNENRKEKFSVSVLAINCSNNINGVSKIHGRVSREMFQYFYDGYFPKEINIGYVTNGVHTPTWAANVWYKKDKDYLHNINNISNEDIWQIHQTLKRELIDFTKQRLQSEMKKRAETPDLYIKTVKGLEENILMIGFARRFATYKRANLLFTDLERLASIVNKGVRFIFAGKAHPADKQGQDLIKNIINISKMPQFIGKILFIENYDMYVAKHLIRGVDVWLNTPTRPLEASGTSGEKAVMNGVINFSVMDGWWAEGYRANAGWALSEQQIYPNHNEQNIFDAEIIYSTIENEIIPAYYTRNQDNIPLKWVEYIKNTISLIAPDFTMQRQMNDYFYKYYNPMFKRINKMSINNYELTKQYASWKEDMRSLWDSIELISVQIPDAYNKKFDINDTFKAKVVLYCGKINPEYIGIEMLIAEKENNQVLDYELKKQFILSSVKNARAEYTIEIPFSVSGVHNYAFRVYAKHSLMHSRMDLPLVKWI